jgi:abequosyltransferase
MKNNLLSIFIPTYNRGYLIGETLDSFIEQVSKYRIQIVISDNCSTDDTSEVIERYKSKYPYIKYSKNETNVGFDGNVIKMADLVDTKYCWLFGDDDIINEGAIDTIMNLIEKKYDLIVVNASLKSIDLSKQITYRNLAIDEDKVYNGKEKEKAFLDLVMYTSFIGGLIVKCELWRKIDYTKYLKTGFVHVGIAFEYLNIESSIYYVSTPFVNIRLGNSGWSKNAFEIWNVLWVKAINNIPNYIDSVKEMVFSDFRKVSLKRYVIERARGTFREDVYKRFFKKDTSISIKKKFFLQLILLIPVSFLRFFWKKYLKYKKPPSFEYQLYELDNVVAKETNYL